MNLRDKCSQEKKNFARAMRHNPTKAEAILWQALRKKKVNGLAFGRQRVIRGYIADFWCPSRGLVIEVDGSLHDRGKDAKRDADLAALGVLTLRFSNERVFSETYAIVSEISKVAAKRPAMRWGRFAQG